MGGRREAVKARSGASAFASNEKQRIDASKLKVKQVEEEDDGIEDPFFSFQSMETVLGEQRMDLHKMIHAYHETSMKFLIRKELSWRKAEEELQLKDKEAKGLAHLAHQASEHKEYKRVLDLLEKHKTMVLEKDKCCREAQAENFELREQLAAMQAVGAGYAKILSPTVGNMDRVPWQEEPTDWPLELPQPPSRASSRPASTARSSKRAVAVAVPVSSRGSSKPASARPVGPPLPAGEPVTLRGVAKGGSITGFMEQLDRVEGDALDRLDRAQAKLDNWAAFQNRKPDPVEAGLVDFNTLEIPAAPGSLDEKAMLDEEGFMAIKDGKIDKVAKTEEKEVKEAGAAEEGEDHEEDGFEHAYLRQRTHAHKHFGGKKVLNMKASASQLMAVSRYNVKDYYKKTGCVQAIARSQYFENTVMAVIAVNALWIGVDMSVNKADMLVNAEPQYIVIENLFCLFFSAEIVIRLMAFLWKCQAFRDMWFCFDFTLVCFMMFETWVVFGLMSIAGIQNDSFWDSSVLRLLKLLRLSRVGRIVRLLRKMPEVMILLKGIGVASRSVAFTVALLTTVVYIFGIAFTQLAEDTKLGEEYFPNLVEGMFSLLFHGCFLSGLPGLAKACFKEHVLFGALLCSFILIAPLTVMNMLVGVLVEVVGIVAAAEQDASTEKFVTDSIRTALGLTESSSDDTLINKDRFATLIESQAVVDAFQDAEIDVIALVRDPDIIFAGDEAITVKEFCEEILTLRGTNSAKVKDLVQLRKQLLRELQGQLKKKKRPFSAGRP